MNKALIILETEISRFSHRIFELNNMLKRPTIPAKYIDMQKSSNLDEILLRYGTFEDSNYLWWNIMTRLVFIDRFPQSLSEWDSVRSGLASLSVQHGKKLDVLIIHLKDLHPSGREMLDTIFAEFVYYGKRIFGVFKKFIEYEIDYIFRHLTTPETRKSFNVTASRTRWLVSSIFEDRYYPISKLNWKYLLINAFNLDIKVRAKFFTIIVEQNIHPIPENQRRKDMLVTNFSNHLLNKTELGSHSNLISNMYNDFIRSGARRPRDSNFEDDSQDIGANYVSVYDILDIIPPMPVFNDSRDGKDLKFDSSLKYNQDEGLIIRKYRKSSIFPLNDLVKTLNNGLAFNVTKLIDNLKKHNLNYEEFKNYFKNSTYHVMMDKNKYQFRRSRCVNSTLPYITLPEKFKENISKKLNCRK